MTTSIQALVETLKWLQDNYALVLNNEKYMNLGIEKIDQALDDYHKSQKEDLKPEVQSPDESTVATLLSSSPNSIELLKEVVCSNCGKRFKIKEIQYNEGVCPSCTSDILTDLS